MVLKFCANLSFMFQETTNLLERYALASNYGFKGVECANPYVCDIKQLIDVRTKNNNIQQILINSPSGDMAKGQNGFAAIPTMKKEFDETLNISINYAKALNCNLIHVTAGKINEINTDNHLMYENNIKQAVKLFEKNNITAVIEPINNYTVPNYYLNNYNRALEIINKINSPNLKLQLDLFHLQQIKGNITRTIRELIPYVAHMQVAQVPNRNEPNTDGELNYRYLFSLIEDCDYNGWIGLEYKPAKMTEDGLNWLEEFGYKL